MTTTEERTSGQEHVHTAPFREEGGEGDEKKRYDELADRLGAAEGVEKDIALYLAENWQRCLGGLVVLLLAIWLFGEFKHARARKMGEASARLSEAQGYLAEISKPAEPVEKEGEEKAEDKEASQKQRKAFADTTSLLKDGQSGDVYGDFAELYIAQEAFRSKNYKQAKQQLAELGISENFELPQTADMDKDRIVSELGALLYVRVLLDESADNLPQARALLEKLVAGGKLVEAEALIALIRVAETKEQKEQAKNLASNLLSRRPEKTDIIRRELSNLGV